MRMRSVRVSLSVFLLAAGLPLLAPSAAQAAADGCAAGVQSDFNGDGRSDTVVADPYARP